MAKFSVYFVLDNEKLEGKCKLCISPTIIKFSRSSKTNLKTHIETVHRLTSPEEKASAIGSQVIQQAFTGPAIFHAQQAITDAVVDMIIEENLPLRFVEKPRFRKVLRTASSGKYKNVCKKTVRAKVIEKGNSWKFNYTDYKRLFGKPSTTVAVDLWSSNSKKRREYMAVSIRLQSHMYRGRGTKVIWTNILERKLT